MQVASRGRSRSRFAVTASLGAVTAALGLSALTTSALATGAALSVSAPVEAAADTSSALADAPVSAIQEVVVTARKRVENVQNVPISVSVVDAKKLDQNHQYQLEDLNFLAPSINVTFFNPRGSYVALRGLGNNPASDGLESSVGIFVDGVYLGRPGMAVFDFADLNSIEVLRGPQGTLFGKNTSAGALNITTKQPSFTFGADMEGSVGNYDFRQLRGDITGTLIPDLVAFRFAFYGTSHSGYMKDPITGEDSNSSNRDGGRLQFLLTPTPKLSVRLIADYNVEKDSCCALVVASFGPSSATYLSRVQAAGGTAVLGAASDVSDDNSPNRMKIRQVAYTAQTDYDFGPVNLTSISGFRNWLYRALYDGDGSSASLYNTASAAPTNDWQFSQELRLANQKSGPVDIVGGLYYFQQRLRSDTHIVFGNGAANFLADSTTPAAAYLAYNNADSSTYADVWTHSYAAFSQATWHLTSKLDLTGGLRGTYETKDAAVNRAKNAVQALYSDALSTNGFDPSGTISLDYKITPDIIAYVNYSRGAKAGGINPVVPGSGITADELIIKPETTDNYEGGLKLTAFQHHLQVNSDIFYEHVGNYQANYYAGTAASPQSILTNVGDVTSWGLESEITVVPFRGLQLNSSLSFNEATYDNYAKAPCGSEIIGQTVCDITGRPLSGAPKWIANLSGEYTHNITPDVEGYGGAEFNYKSHYYGNLDDSRYSLTGGYGTLNLNVGVREAKMALDLSFWVKNVNDGRHIETDPSGGASEYGAYLGTIENPRTFGATLKKSF